MALALSARAALAGDATNAAIHPEIWPMGASGLADDPALDAKVAALLAQMPVEDKVGQIVQPDIATLTPDDVRKYRFGSIMSGGNSGPGNNDRAPPPAWLKAADDYYAAEMEPAPGHTSHAENPSPGGLTDQDHRTLRPGH